MKDIKFRGLNKRGRWVYGEGVYTSKTGETYIIPLSEIFGENITGSFETIRLNPLRRRYKVDPKSVGQYTGLKDVNNREIYEGDIVKLKDFYYEDVIGIVKFGDGEFYVDCIPQDNPYSSCIIGMASINEQEIEVIGNIYENPELLEVSKND